MLHAGRSVRLPGACAGRQGARPAGVHIDGHYAPDIHMMDKQDAADSLTFVVVRLVTPAAKCAVEEEAAAAGRVCVAQHVGAALAAEREISRAVR